MIFSRSSISLLVFRNLLLEAVNKLAQSQIELLAALQDGIWWSNLPVRLNFHLDLLLKRMAFLVSGEPDSRVLQKLVPDAISKSVILVLDDHSALEPLTRVVLVGDPINL